MIKYGRRTTLSAVERSGGREDKENSRVYFERNFEYLLKKGTQKQRTEVRG